MAERINKARTVDTIPGLYKVLRGFAEHVGAQSILADAGGDLLVSAERVFDALSWSQGLDVPCRVADYSRFDAPQWLISVARHAPQFVTDDLADNRIQCASVAISRDDTIRPEPASAGWW